MTYYRHYKGGLYEFVMEGVHTETEEEMVVYKGEDGRVWIRPKAMFFENVDGTPRFRPTRDPAVPRWRPIPGWCDEEGRGWQLSDCGQLRDTSDGEEVYNDHDEVCGVVYPTIDFNPCHIQLYGDDEEGRWRESTFTFSALRKAVSEGQPPIPIREEYPETD